MITALSRRSDRSKQNQTKASIVYLRHVDDKPRRPASQFGLTEQTGNDPATDNVKAAPKKSREFLISGHGNRPRVVRAIVRSGRPQGVLLTVRKDRIRLVVSGVVTVRPPSRTLHPRAAPKGSVRFARLHQLV